MTRRMSSRRVTLPTTFLLIASGTLLGACDTAEDEREDGHFYCTDANGVVVDEDYCDESSPNYNSGGFIYFMGSSLHTPPAGHSTYPAGQRLPANSAKMRVNDSAARAKFGLPAKGKISNGTVKTGVVGKGGVGSGAKGGSGTGKGGGSGGG